MIGFFSLVLMQDLENEQRKWQMVDGQQVRTPYWTVVLESSPSTFTSNICLLVVMIPKLHHLVSMPFIINAPGLAFYGVGLNSMGTGIGLTFGAINIGRGYGWRITAIVGILSFLLGPLFTYAFDLLSPPYNQFPYKAASILAIQSLLYFLSKNFPLAFEGMKERLLNRWNWRHNRTINLVDAFELSPEYFSHVVSRFFSKQSFHRCGSQVPVVITENSVFGDFNTLVKVAANHLGNSNNQKFDYYVIRKPFQEDDELQETMQKVIQGEGKCTLEEIKKIYGMDWVLIEWVVEGEFEHTGNRSIPRFRLQIYR
ncbi:unnamed protein product [Caenorhabditis nigoni]